MVNLPFLLGYIASGFLGAVIGSFLNVCIYRLPRSMSIISPGSHCPHCGKPIVFYDNIPILSYLFLKGKCRNCNTLISFKYPLVEFLNTILYLLVFWKFGYAFSTLFFFSFCSALLIVTFVDLEFRIIPDSISLPGIIVGFIASFFSKWISPLDSLMGIFLGGGFLFLVAVFYEKVMKKEGMGGGDIKLLAMIGAFLGWKSIPFVILVSSFLGACVGMLVIFIRKKDTKYAIPFGPFLSLAAILYLFVGPPLIRWYLSLGKVG